MINSLEFSLLGELRISYSGKEIELPSSRKARALIAFLVATGRPHRRERLCELLWPEPEDPKAALRWSLSKLRSAISSSESHRIIADRERVQFDVSGVSIDIRDIQNNLLKNTQTLSIPQLEDMSNQLSRVFLDGLDYAGDETFRAWLVAERDDVQAALLIVYRCLANHPDMSAVGNKKWLRLWREIDPESANLFESTPRTPKENPPPFNKVPSEQPTDILRKSRTSALHAQKIGFCVVPDGTKVAYASVGSGPPILKAANWLSHLEFDWNSPIWGATFTELARNRSFIRYDERGCGLSDWDIKNLTFEAFVEDLEAVADCLNLKRFPLVGISQGAAVSIEYAVRHPERVSGLILISGYAAGWRYLTSIEEQKRREAVCALTEVGWGTDNPAYRHIFSQTFMPKADPDDLSWFDEFQRLTTSPKNAAYFQDAFGRIDVRQQLSKIDVPTIIFHSRYDQRIPFEVGHAMASEIPNSTFVPLDSHNHILLNNEPAWRICMDQVSQFLEKHKI